MSFLRSLYADLRERQMLPAVVLLLILAIAIPVAGGAVFSKSAAPGPVSEPPVATTTPPGTPAPDQALAAVNTAPSQTSEVFKGQEPNPFRAARKSTTSTATTTPAVTTTTPAVTTTTPTTTPTTTVHSTTPSTTTTKPAPKEIWLPKAPSSLADDQAYVADVVTTYAGKTHTSDDLQRLAPLPANATSEVVFLGVMKGGKRAAFLLTGAVPAALASFATDPCIPSPTACQVIEVGVGHSFSLTPPKRDGQASKLTIALHALHAFRFSSSAEAAGTRDAASAAGEQLISSSSSTALADFFFDRSIGALIYEAPTTAGSTGSSGATG
jgi:hypothetical protein